MEEHSPVGAWIPRAAYRDVGTTYGQSFDTHHYSAHPPSTSTSTSTYFPLAPRLVLTPEQEARPDHAPRDILPPIDAQHAQQIEELWTKLRVAGRSYTDRRRCWILYQALPSPRPRYLEDKFLRKLLYILGLVEFKTLVNYERYFSVVDEWLAEGVPLTVKEWNKAISFAGRWVRRSSNHELRTAVETWMRMEKQGAIPNKATFNILFDVAVRAGRFALADTIYKELAARGLREDRYLRTGLIFYAGIRGDGDAVRQAFRDLVNAGEIVDTAVMNCVMRSLILCGEMASAEDVFDKMKLLHHTKFGVEGPRNWRERRLLGKHLEKVAYELQMEREEHEASFFGSTFSTELKKEEAQRAAPIHPNDRSYQILIQHHAHRTGDWERVCQLMAEMREEGWHVHGKIYVAIWYGFWHHGGYVEATWSRKRLEALWEEFLGIVQAPPNPKYSLHASDLEADEGGEEEWDAEAADVSNEHLPPYFTPRMAIAILSAFYRCAGAKRMLQVWEQIQHRWPEMSAQDEARVQRVVRRFRAEDDMYITAEQ